MTPTKAEPVLDKNLNGAGKPLQLRRLVILSTVAVAVVLPLIPLGLAAFSKGYAFPQVLPANWSLRAWSFVTGSDSGTWEALGWSAAVAAAVTIVALAVALPAGRALGMHVFSAKRVVELLVMVPLLVPAVAVAIGLDVTFIRLGLSGTFIGVVIVHLIFAGPYAVLVMAGVFANYDDRFEHQARSLGAGPLSVLRFVTLPAVLPGLLVAGFFAFIVSWSQYVLSLQIGGGSVVTLPVLLVSTAAGGDLAVTGAMTIIYTVPVVLLLGAASRHLIRSGFGATGT